MHCAYALRQGPNWHRVTAIFACWKHCLPAVYEWQAGRKNIVFDSIPYSGSEREIALDKIRTDIMAGEGAGRILVETVQGSSSVFPPGKGDGGGLFCRWIRISRARHSPIGIADTGRHGGRADGRGAGACSDDLHAADYNIYRKEDVPEAPPSGRHGRKCFRRNKYIAQCSGHDE